jgi:hypothetical protein
MNVASIRFPGQVLKRGFWLYVIDIRSPERRLLYVGRTGDSSSPHAGSPFGRISQHLDLRPNAKGNALFRNLRRVGVDPSECELEMIAVGPFFPEQTTFKRHKLIRDQMAALEMGVAKQLHGRGFEVLGTHAAREPADPSVLSDVLRLVESKLMVGEPPNSALQPPQSAAAPRGGRASRQPARR